MSFITRHYDHGGNALGEAFPQNLTFGVYLGRGGYANYDLNFDQNIAKRNNCEPFVTDWALFYDDIKLIAGYHSAVEISETESNMISVNGLDWYSYLDGRQFPFDPAAPVGYSATGRDIALVAKDILDLTLAEPYSLTFDYSTIAAIGQTTNYKIDPADSTSILSKITDLSKLTPGFDLDISPDRVLKLYSPRKGVINDNIVLELGSNITSPNYRNSGIGATRLVGIGSTSAGTRLGKTATGKADIYRRWDKSVDLDVKDTTLLQAATDAELTRQNTPVVLFSCKWADPTVNIFKYVSIGDTLLVEGDLQWDVYANYLRLVGIEGSPNENGEVQWQLNFDDGTLSL